MAYFINVVLLRWNIYISALKSQVGLIGHIIHFKQSRPTYRRQVISTAEYVLGTVGECK